MVPPLDFSKASLTFCKYICGSSYGLPQMYLL